MCKTKREGESIPQQGLSHNSPFPSNSPLRIPGHIHVHICACVQHVFGAFIQHVDSGFLCTVPNHCTVGLALCGSLRKVTCFSLLEACKKMSVLQTVGRISIKRNGFLTRILQRNLTIALFASYLFTPFWKMLCSRMS